MIKIFKSNVRFLLVILLLLSVNACDDSKSSSPSNPLIRTTEQGRVRGVDEGTTYAFKGVPYAAPPVGNLRFAPPQEPADRTGTMEADEFCSTCPQNATSFGAGSTNEDCLYLNISIPKGSGPYPVMVWIHGGALITGSGSEAGYDATRLVAEDVVVVTINYRLGALGFLAHPVLTEEEGESSNYGLMDQQMAMQWVQDNIANFNGDPDNVTIFGESAGGHSILSHLTTSAAGNLFHKVIVQSGSYSPWQKELSVAETEGLNFGGCAGTNAEVLSCLRTLTVEEVLTAQGASWPLPAHGGTFLPDSIETVIAAGTFPDDIPIMIGSNLNEGRLFVLLDMLNVYTAAYIASLMGGGTTEEAQTAGGTAAFSKYYTEAEYDTAVDALLAEDPRGLTAADIGDDYIVSYPFSAAQYGYKEALAALRTDWQFASNNLNHLEQITANGNDVYGYWFTDEEAPNSFSSFSSLLPALASHSYEIQYVFGQVEARGGTVDQIALSEEMVGYWTRFAKNGDPNGTGAIIWNQFSSSNFILELDDDTGPVASDATAYSAFHNCSYWDGL